MTVIEKNPKYITLFYNPGACSLAVHIALAQAGISYNLVRITREKKTDDGRDFLKINPKGFIPTLELPDGSVLAETMAILVYIADQAENLLPLSGQARWRTLEDLSFMATEIHSNFKPFWKAGTAEEKDKARHLLIKQFSTIANGLGDGPFLAGTQMTIADPYLLVMLMWANTHGIELSDRLDAYLAVMKRVPAVAKALAEEGLT